MKKGLLASLIAYAMLLVSVVAMMLTYIILKNQGVRNHALFNAVTYVFIAFVVVFIAVIVLLILYPKTLQKEYRSNIEGFLKEHNEKYPNNLGQVVVTYKDKNVYIAFIMGEKEMDTYSFVLKEKPLTKSEPKRMTYNTIEEIVNPKEK
ncbi:MAG: hypothetical protein K6G38_05385 [Gammaproteobacteria bacterium]|nr:hypothetical protein [Gammaproteobacteria bacterium]